jgi:DNA topoisomerase-1
MTASGIVYVSDEEPGYRRRKAGRGFVYLDERGRRITEEKTVQRIRSLAIPPAWTEVWICPNPHGHLQAVGRDAKGRKQYRYHAGWRAEREHMKYERLIDFGEALPPIRRRMAEDLRRRSLDHDRVVAAVVHLLESTLIRVGNEEYARTNGSFGLTTMRSRQVSVDGSEVRFVFTGKSGQRHDVSVEDPRTARVIQRCQDLPGQRLFQYEDDDGDIRPIGSSDVNDYLREASGEDFTAKDFRTWMGTLFTAAALAALDPPASEAEGRRVANAAIAVAAKHLGNTPAVARTSYVHPDVVDLFIGGELPELWKAGASRGSRWLLLEERRLLTLLKTARRRQARAVRTAAKAA